jgi:NTP pyrophosphatase (non-canonical NTP hydrolase)
MPDTDTTIAQLRQIVEAFVSERDWRQFHTPKNLAMAMAIETAELMEHFQWLTPEQSRALAEEPEKLREVGEEVADVLCYLMAMANELGLDLSTAVRDKMVKNAQKYPAAEYRGRFGPDDPGPGRAE